MTFILQCAMKLNLVKLWERFLGTFIYLFVDLGGSNKPEIENKIKIH